MTGPQIHAPEAIQPHGVLLAFRTDDGTLERCSANAAAVLGASREALAGRTIGEVLGPDIARQIGAAAPTQWGATLIPRRFVDPAGGRHSVQFFAGGHHLVVEIEPQPDEEEDAFELLARTQTGLEALRAVADPRRLAQGLAELASEILGFDRIVVFRFDKDWNRDVIAEVRSETMPGSFLGLRVPAAALPPTARLLYLRAGVRPIVDVDAAATPIIAASGGMPATTPLDLSDSTLRSPPIEHVSHLRSVGVRASLTVAIETGGRLWGILTAHNRQPRLLSAARRATVRLLATSIAALLAAREEASRDHATTERTLQISRAASDILARDLEAAPALQAFAAALVTTTGAGGAVIRVAGIEVGAGSMPDRATVERILQVARGRMEAGRAAIESLAEADPALAPHGASASGLVAMALPGGDGDILALLHGEISEEIVWATAPGDRPTDAGLPWVPAIFRRDSGPVGADEPRVERTRGVARGWPDEVGPLLDVAREAVFDICRVTGE
ncbi:MAG: GAF domain-containing protein, partial [Alphaproteobacteria bacterium]